MDSINYFIYPLSFIMNRDIMTVLYSLLASIAFGHEMDSSCSVHGSEHFDFRL